MKNLIILTNSFPYEGGEQFIESEVHYWANTAYDKVYIVPNSKSEGKIRFYPKDLTLYPRVKLNIITIINCLIASLISSMMWKDFFYLLKEKKLKFPTLKALLKTVLLVNLKKKQLNKLLKNINGEIYVYSYWNDVDFYAACELKKNKKIKSIISRAHRYDLYEEFRDNSYMPLKRQYSNVVDKIYLLTNSAKEYYNYNYNYNVLDVAKLGVFLPSSSPDYKIDRTEIKVLSISNCISIKRVDKIVDALNEFSAKEKIKVDWVDVGDGALLDKLKQQAREVQMIKKNKYFKSDFLGYLPNSEVKKLLSKQSFDLFINASESEGVPVSIMEAMSYSIPVIAPDVGEISDIVNDSTGKLLNSEPSILNFVEAIQEIYFSEKYFNYRENALLMVKQNYNAEKNYKKFINNLDELILNE